MAALEDALQQMSASKVTSAEEAKALEKQLNAAEATVSQHKSNDKELQESLAAMTASEADSAARAKLLGEQGRALEMKLAGLEAESSEKEATISQEAAGNLKETEHLNSNIAQLEGSLKHANASLNTLTEEKMVLQKRVALSQADVAEKVAAIGELEARAAAVSADMAKRAEDALLLEERYAMDKQRVALLETELMANADRIELLTTDKMAVTDQLQQKLASVEENKSTLGEHLTELQGQLDGGRDTITRHESAQSHLVALLGITVEGEDASTQVSKAVETVIADKERLSTEADEGKQRVDKLSQQTSALNATLVDLRQNCDSLLSDKNELRETNTEQSTQVCARWQRYHCDLDLMLCG